LVGRVEVKASGFAEERDELESALGVHNFPQGRVDGVSESPRPEDRRCLAGDILIYINRCLGHAFKIRDPNTVEARILDLLASSAGTLDIGPGPHHHVAMTYGQLSLPAAIMSRHGLLPASYLERRIG